MANYNINKEDVVVSFGVNDNLIMDFIAFVVENRIEDNSPCTWFFTEDNKITAYSDEFANPESWFKLLKDKFFRPRGIEIEDPEILCFDNKDNDFRILISKRIHQFIDWKFRIFEIVARRCCLD